MKTIDIQDKFAKIHKTWTPYIVAEVNGQQVKMAKLKGDFIWHSHENEDELFFVVEGDLFLDFREEETVHLTAGQMFVVPKGVEHKPYTGENGASVMLFEPGSTKHTGAIVSEVTVEHPEWI